MGCNKIFLCRNRVGQGKEELSLDRGFLGHDRAGHNREEAMHARQNRPREHDRPWACTTGLHAGQENSVYTNLDRVGQDRKFCRPRQS